MVPRHSWLGAFWCWWWVARRLSWLRSWARFPASPGWGPLAAVVAVSAGFGGGLPVLRLFVARRVLVCALCVCGGGVGVGVSSVCVGACVAACGGLFPWLGLAAAVSLGGVVVAVWAVPRHS